LEESCLNIILIFENNLYSLRCAQVSRKLRQIPVSDGPGILAIAASPVTFAADAIAVAADAVAIAVAA
jgi:hypothetical protein